MRMHWLQYWNILITASLFLLVSCGQKLPESQVFIDERIPDEIVDSVYITSSNRNKLEYELYAVRIRKFYHTGQTFADTVSVRTFNDEGDLVSTLYCDSAELDETANKLTGTGNVVVESENGILKTNHIIWDRNTDKIQASKGVILIREGNVLKGSEMKTDINLDRIEITSVSAEGKVDEEEIDW